MTVQQMAKAVVEAEIKIIKTITDLCDEIPINVSGFTISTQNTDDGHKVVTGIRLNYAIDMETVLKGK